jgi:hypothetical protein
LGTLSKAPRLFDERIALDVASTLLRTIADLGPVATIVSLYHVDQYAPARPRTLGRPTPPGVIQQRRYPNQARRADQTPGPHPASHTLCLKEIIAADATVAAMPPA